MAQDFPDHQKKIKRLNRIEGQVAGIGRMIEDRRYCLDIITQTRAAQAALKALESEILKTHLAACVKEAMTSGDDRRAQEKIDELETLFKKM